MRRLLVAGAMASLLLAGPAWASGNPPGGRLDRSFGTAGVVATPEGQSPSAAFVDGVASWVDGATVVVGIATGPAGNGVFAVARYRADGRPDPGFGSGGAATTDFRLGGDDLAQGVAVTPQGKIVVVGDAANFGDSRYSWAIAEYDANGSLDPAFGNGGLVTSDFAGLT